MGLVKRVRDKLDTRCLVDGRLKKKDCKVSMTGVTEPRLVVDFDKPGSRGVQTRRSATICSSPKARTVLAGSLHSS